MQKPYGTLSQDCPELADDLVVIWWANEHKWPDARRVTRYLTTKLPHAFDDGPRFSAWWENADTFKTTAEARAFLKEARNRTKRPLGELYITTVAELKQMLGFTKEGAA